jgi:hypothetical protein
MDTGRDEDGMDLLTFEEGLTGHPLSGEVYVCVNEEPDWFAEQIDLLDVEEGFAS